MFAKNDYRRRRSTVVDTPHDGANPLNHDLVTALDLGLLLIGEGLPDVEKPRPGPGLIFGGPSASQFVGALGESGRFPLWRSYGSASNLLKFSEAHSMWEWHAR